jgi:ergothioneine biosynthesis protein EgtC
MCRLLGYLGPKIQLDQILYQPEHSLIVQSYQPQEMTAGLLNADGFGVGWFHPEKETQPYIYKSVLPIWSEINLPHISRYVETHCILSYVRSATPGLAVDLSNCQPFTKDNLLFIHNGFIDDFRKTLYRSIRSLLDNETYEWIQGTTDSEHIFALFLHELKSFPELNFNQALKKALKQLINLAKIHQVRFSANIIISDGKQIIASRYSNQNKTPTLYWLKDDLNYPGGVIIASEPLFKGDWNFCPESSIINVTENLDVIIDAIL